MHLQPAKVQRELTVPDIHPVRQPVQLLARVWDVPETRESCEPLVAIEPR